ncbi:protein SCO1/2 [Modestobacter sp. DSM 44400]|uniref:SCO family protein n=1 Tax=Modestobacter sp. DSM 44400 TaxID=1550230 RepID=UPI00089D2BE7|nr:SCO family protein [Modestobacter sp. DSM 44400]SDY85516.1 protein SCO1/2 [Modestobacter sp. DSM 44400]
MTLTAVAASVLGAGCSGGPAHDHGSRIAQISVPGSSYAGSRLAEPWRRPAFTLIDQDGQPFDFTAETAGKPTLLFFGYTHCPDVCPTTMADISRALQDVPRDVASRTRVVFVTTDPARDTPEALGPWLSLFDRQLPNRFIGLAGTQAEVDLAQQAARVPLVKSNGTEHANSVLLYGPDGPGPRAPDSGRRRGHRS